jgi:hypothetical protein
VNPFGRELRAEWFPTTAVKTIAEAGAPIWLVEIFERLLAANGGELGGFLTCSPGVSPARSDSMR